MSRGGWWAEDAPGALLGGGRVVRVGGTVRRPAGPWTPAVHALLRHLEAVGFDAAPRALGIDRQGREVLSYVEGEVVGKARPYPQWVWDEATLTQVAKLLRHYHDAVAGFRPPPGTRWRFRTSGVGVGEVVCHNDVSPRNIVFDGASVCAMIDWDTASPHEPIWDVAHVVWQFVPLLSDAVCRSLGWRSPPDRAWRLRLFCDVYGLRNRDSLIRCARRRIEASREGILRMVAAGDPVGVQLQADGALEEMKDTLAFVDAAGGGLEVSL